ncbi:MAG: type II toxin-antitoxin system VapC family toxin [Burkholderiales bacterium]
MLAVDTNVLTYLLIEGDRTPQAQALYARDPDWRSEAFLLVEFSNILATYERRGALGADAAAALLAAAERVTGGFVNLPHARALVLAGEFGVSAYDARFLGAALALGTKLVTEDARLRAAAPQLTCSIGQALEG